MSAPLRVAVDLHCHVLPALDDGARDLGDAVEMAKQAEADGITAICATPHIRHDHDVRIHELPARVAELAGAVREAGCGVRVLPGAEVAVSALPGLDDAALRSLTLGGSGRWILLEPPPGPLDDRLDDAVGRLCTRGFRALIAHPERHLAPDLIDRLTRLVAQGALVQATAAFLTDATTAPGMLALARAGVLHVLGSDAHSSHAGRPVLLTPAVDVLRTVERLASQLEWVARTAPLAMISGEDITPPF